MMRLKDIIKEAKSEIFSGDTISLSTYNEFKRFYIMDENYFHNPDIEFQKYVFDLLKKRINNDKIIRLIYDEASSKYPMSQYVYYIYCLGRSYHDIDNFRREYEGKLVKKERGKWIYVKLISLICLIVLLILMIYNISEIERYVFRSKLLLNNHKNLIL